MRSFGAVAAIAVVTLAGCTTTGPGPHTPSAISAAVGDSNRPADDRARDVDRHPAELLAFAQVGQGQKVADYMPGGGYFTRIFAKAVGPQGHVYAVFPQFMAQFDKRDADAIQAMAGTPAYANVSFETTADAAFTVGSRLDLIWTSNNYHDLQFGLSHDQIIALDKSIYGALKPGGIFLIIDHAATPGAGWTAAKTLHRIDPDAIKADMAQAGFKLEAESPLLRNTKDPRTAVIFDPSIRGHTDQVVFRFRRPK